MNYKNVSTFKEKKNKDENNPQMEDQKGKPKVFVVLFQVNNSEAAPKEYFGS